MPRTKTQPSDRDHAAEVPFAFSDHPDAVAARLLGAYRAMTDTRRRDDDTTPEAPRVIVEE